MKSGRPYSIMLVALFLLSLSLPVQAQGLSLPVQAQGDPAQVVEGFLQAWATQDYATMYSLLSDPSRSQYTQPVFEQIYIDALRSPSKA